MKLRATKEACKYMRLEARTPRLVSGLQIKSPVHASPGSIGPSSITYYSGMVRGIDTRENN